MKAAEPKKKQQQIIATAALVAVLPLSSCAGERSLQHYYHLRLWEKFQTRAQDRLRRQASSERLRLLAAALDEARRLGRADIHVGISLNEMGKNHLRSKDLAAAKQCFEEAARILQADSFSADSSEFLRRLQKRELSMARSGQGEVMAAKGEMEAAAKCLENSSALLAFLCSTGGSAMDTRDYAHVLSRLAVLRTQCGKEEEAKNLFARALALGGDPATENAALLPLIDRQRILATARSFLGASAYTRLCQPLMQAKVEALVAYQKFNLAAAECMQAGDQCLNAGLPELAAPWYRQELDIRRRLSAGAHPSLLTAMHKFADAKIATNDFASAEPVLKECLLIHRKYGAVPLPATPDVTCWLLARLYAGKGEDKVAQEYYKQSIAGMRRHGDHLSADKAALEWGRWKAAKEPARAVDHYKRCLSILHGAGDSALCKSWLALAYCHSGKNKEALEFGRLSVREAAAVFPPESIELLGIQCALADICISASQEGRDRGLIEEAQRIYSAALPALRSSKKKDAAWFCQILQHAALMYSYLGDRESAAQLEAESRAISGGSEVRS